MSEAAQKARRARQARYRERNREKLRERERARRGDAVRGDARGDARRVDDAEWGEDAPEMDVRDDLRPAVERPTRACPFCRGRAFSRHRHGGPFVCERCHPMHPEMIAERLEVAARGEASGEAGA